MIKPTQADRDLAGWFALRMQGDWGNHILTLIASHAEQSRLQERERCAGIALRHAELTYMPSEFTDGYETAARKIARAIRKGETE